MNELDVANAALAFIGASRIDDLDEASQEARVCKQHIDNIRITMLSAFDWTFARKRELLAENVTNSLKAVWDYSYKLPFDNLRIVGLTNDLTQSGVDEICVEYYTETGNIYSDLEKAQLVYVYDKSEYQDFSYLFKTALSWRLAEAIAPIVTGDDNKRIIAQKNATVYYLRATAEDANKNAASFYNGNLMR